MLRSRPCLLCVTPLVVVFYLAKFLDNYVQGLKCYVLQTLKPFQRSIENQLKPEVGE